MRAKSAVEIGLGSANAQKRKQKEAAGASVVGNLRDVKRITDVAGRAA
jgi:hypothetical protein